MQEALTLCTQFDKTQQESLKNDENLSTIPQRFCKFMKNSKCNLDQLQRVIPTAEIFRFRREPRDLLKNLFHCDLLKCQLYRGLDWLPRQQQDPDTSI